MFTDTVGFSALAQENEQRALALLRSQREMAIPVFEAHHGTLIKSTGDGFFVEFDNALAAARCAVELQERARERDEEALEMRVGLHLGDVVREGDDVYGDGVNIASRVEGCAPPGGVCVTGAVAHQIENKLERPLVPMGVRRLKNIEQPVALYRIVMPWEDPDALGRSEAARRVLRRFSAPAAAVAAVFALAALAWWSLGGGGSPEVSSAGDIRSLAVLPLENLSGDPDQEYFADGMTEALINDLGKIGALTVISRTSAMRFKDSDLSAPEIAERLGVDAVLEGAVLRSGDRVRITTQLIDALTDRNLWGESYTRDVRDVLALQNEVARDVADRVRVALTPEETRRLAEARRVDPRAHEEYLRGRARWRAAPEGLPEAIDYFDRALEIDSDYALAHAGLADAWLVFAHFGQRPREALARAKAAALRALELDPDLADAHTALADARFHLDWNWQAAEEGFRRALEINPGSSTARFWYAGLLSALGRHDEAIEQIDRAKALDPFYPVAHGFAVRVYYWAERGELVRAAVVDLDERFVDGSGTLNVYAFLAADLPRELVSRMRAARTDGAAGPPLLVTLALQHARAGTDTEARRILEGLEASLGDRMPYQIARIHAAMGETDEALEWLDRAAEARDAALPWVHVEPLFDPLHDDPRYRRLIERMGLGGDRSPPAA